LKEFIFQRKINTQIKIHPKRLEKICRDINTGKKTIYNNSNVNNGTINNTNTTINNVVVYQLGYEDLSVLSKKEKISILNYGYKSLDHLIEHIHFNDNYPQFKNVAITNINNDLCKEK